LGQSPPKKANTNEKLRQWHWRNQVDNLCSVLINYFIQLFINVFTI